MYQAVCSIENAACEAGCLQDVHGTAVVGRFAERQATIGTLDRFQAA
jgi:hypothetical protein